MNDEIVLDIKNKILEAFSYSFLKFFYNINFIEEAREKGELKNDNIAITIGAKKNTVNHLNTLNNTNDYYKLYGYGISGYDPNELSLHAAYTFTGAHYESYKKRAPGYEFLFDGVGRGTMHEIIHRMSKIAYRKSDEVDKYVNPPTFNNHDHEIGCDAITIMVLGQVITDNTPNMSLSTIFDKGFLKLCIERYRMLSYYYSFPFNDDVYENFIKPYIHTSCAEKYNDLGKEEYKKLIKKHGKYRK